MQLRQLLRKVSLGSAGSSLPFPFFTLRTIEPAKQVSQMWMLKGALLKRSCSGELARETVDRQTPAVVTLYVFLLIVGAVGAVAYLLLFFSHVPGAADERFGILEALPGKLGEWVVDEDNSPKGLILERRYLSADPSGADATKLIIQVRYRDPVTGEIVRVDPEETYRRRRRKK